MPKDGTIQSRIYANLQTTVGANWKRLRLEHGLSRREFAEKTGISPSRQADIERAQIKETRISECEKAARLYGFSVEKLIKELTDGAKASHVMPTTDAVIDSRTLDYANMFPQNVFVDAIGEGPSFQNGNLDVKAATEAISSLSDLQQGIIVDLYLKKHSYKQIAEKYDTTPSRIKQIHVKALRRLRSHKKNLFYVPGEKFLEAEALITMMSDIIRFTVYPNAVTIDALRLSTRQYNILMYAGIRYISQLCDMTKDEIARRARSLISKDIEEIESRMLIFGVSFRHEPVNK